VTGIPTATVPRLDDAYIAAMEDVLALYERPYEPRQPVVCLDEKPVALHADVRPATAAAPGREARSDSEYRRCGTVARRRGEGDVDGKPAAAGGLVAADAGDDEPDRVDVLGSRDGVPSSEVLAARRPLGALGRIGAVGGGR